MSNWCDLKSLRDAGMAPAHKLFVFVDRAHAGFRQEMIEIGALVIDHDSRDIVPGELLGGLEVFFMTTICGRTPQFEWPKFFPRRVSAWCECSKAFTVCPGPCQ